MNTEQIKNLFDLSEKDIEQLEDFIVAHESSLLPGFFVLPEKEMDNRKAYVLAYCLLSDQLKDYVLLKLPDVKSVGPVFFLIHDFLHKKDVVYYISEDLTQRLGSHPYTPTYVESQLLLIELSNDLHIIKKHI